MKIAKKRQEAFRRFYVLTAAGIMVALHTVLIYYVFHYNYNNDFRTQLYTKGHIFILALYSLLYVAFGRVFGGLLIGSRRKGEVLFSEVFTVLFTNFIFYLEMMMLSYNFRHQYHCLAQRAFRLFSQHVG